MVFILFLFPHLISYVRNICVYLNVNFTGENCKLFYLRLIGRIICAEIFNLNVAKYVAKHIFLVSVTSLLAINNGRFSVITQYLATFNEFPDRIYRLFSPYSLSKVTCKLACISYRFLNP
jgi:hypothetical protein